MVLLLVRAEVSAVSIILLGEEGYVNLGSLIQPETTTYVARLSLTGQTRRCRLSSHAQLRASQPLAKTSSVEILQNLRTEARY